MPVYGLQAFRSSQGTAKRDASRKKTTTRGWGRSESEGRPVRLFNKSSFRFIALFFRAALHLWNTSTRRSHSAQITSPRVVTKSCLIHRFLSPLLHEQIQIHRRYSILEKTCSCNRIKLNYQATKKKIESTRKHRRLGSKFCDRLHHNYVTCTKNKENTLT